MKPLLSGKLGGELTCLDTAGFRILEGASCRASVCRVWSLDAPEKCLFALFVFVCLLFSKINWPCLYSNCKARQEVLIHVAYFDAV